jgi:hypothetical protein
MDESLVSKQDYIKEFQMVYNTYRKHNPTSTLQHCKFLLSSIAIGPRCGHFGGLVDIATKTALVNG